MKKLIFLTIFISSICSIKGQNTDELLHFFRLDSSDTIINTYEKVNDYYEIYKKNNLSDTVALKYFFDNNPSKMKETFEAYNMDENEYSYSTYTKKVCPILKRQYKNETYLIFYGIESKLYLAYYMENNDKLLRTQLVSDFSDEYGNVYLHSIIFPNYIATVNVDNKVTYILYEINSQNLLFTELKRVEQELNDQTDSEIKKNILIELGISREGIIE